MMVALMMLTLREWQAGWHRQYELRPSLRGDLLVFAVIAMAALEEMQAAEWDAPRSRRFLDAACHAEQELIARIPPGAPDYDEALRLASARWVALAAFAEAAGLPLTVP